MKNWNIEVRNVNGSMKNAISNEKQYFLFNQIPLHIWKYVFLINQNYRKSVTVLAIDLLKWNTWNKVNQSGNFESNTLDK